MTVTSRPALEPFSLGPVRLRNRVFVSAHTTGFGSGENPGPTRRHVAYHAERARGGVGLIITEGIRVHRESHRRFRLGAYSSKAVASFRSLTDAVHLQGARIFCQLFDPGHHLVGDRTGNWSASADPWASGADLPHALTPAEIGGLVRAFAAGAANVEAGGYDGIEVHLGHGHLLHQFLSPVINRRTDRYGSDVDGRLRFPREAVAAVIDATSVPVGIRISADEFIEGGLGVDEMLEITARLLGEFPLAFVNVSHSAYVGSHSLSTQMADMTWGPAPFRQFPRAFKQAFPGVPIFAICRIDTLELADEMVANGEADLVGMTRAHIADPHLVAKGQTTGPGTVRSCIACNQGCIGRLEQQLPISCLVNPEVGLEREFYRLRANTLRRRRNVLVVGGGPGGLQAALQARRNGHAVTLVEAGDALGGQIRWAERVRDRNRIGLLIDELERDVRASEIEVETGRTMAAGEVLAGPWDAVVVATGALHSVGPEMGIPSYTVPGAIEAVEDLTGHVLIFDGDGGWPAAALAADLGARGQQVTVLCPTAAVFPKITVYSRFGLLDRLKRGRVRIRPLREPAGGNGDAFAIRDTHSGDLEQLAGVTALVWAGMLAANDRLYRDLEDRGFHGEVHLVGDAYAPRTALEAVYDGHLAGSILGLGRASSGLPRHVAVRWPVVTDRVRRPA